MSSGIIIGFTGTRTGLTSSQDAALRNVLFALHDEHLSPLELHHGDCVGADARVRAMFLELFPGERVVIHPPVDARFRANCGGEGSSITWRKPRTYQARNRDIVLECDLLLGCPREMVRQTFGGTWYTLDYAKKMFRKTKILWPDGSVSDGVSN